MNMLRVKHEHAVKTALLRTVALYIHWGQEVVYHELPLKLTQQVEREATYGAGNHYMQESNKCNIWSPIASASQN